jgi:hypothetical protein
MLTNYFHTARRNCGSSGQRVAGSCGGIPATPSVNEVFCRRASENVEGSWHHSWTYVLPSPWLLAALALYAVTIGLNVRLRSR